MDDVDRSHLRRCVELARRALETENDPFGSVLVAGDGSVLFEDHNRTASGDQTQHPELAITRWAVNHLSPEERARSTVYTSGEHCPMCAAAHGWAGLGRIVIASSSKQLVEWLSSFGAELPPVMPHPIQFIVPCAIVDGPERSLLAQIRELHRIRTLRNKYRRTRE